MTKQKSPELQYNHITKKQVYDFWQSHPLGSYEIKAEKASKEYFEYLDKIRFESSRFSIHLYRFNDNSSKKVLDAGCGPGWISFNYAKNGADIYSIDLTPIAVEMTNKYFELYKLKAKTAVADVETLPFKDNSFEFCCCDGVLHHTPDTFKAIREIFRILKPKSKALLSFYYQNWMLRKKVFPLTLFLMNILKIRTPHGLNQEKIRNTSIGDLGRLYDGEDNPLGKIFSFSECKELFRKAGFKILKKEIHYFPLRFLPLGKHLPEAIARFLDRMCGTMIYFIVEKSI